jgi:hypothetical protein
MRINFVLFLASVCFFVSLVNDFGFPLLLLVPEFYGIVFCLSSVAVISVISLFDFALRASLFSYLFLLLFNFFIVARFYYGLF